MKLMQEGRYPKVEAYLKNDMPQIIKVPIIADALRRLGRLSHGKLSDALRGVGGPAIWASPYSSTDVPGTVDSWGGVGVISVSKYLLEDFPNWVVLTPRNKRVYRLGVHLLRGLAVWGAAQAGVDFVGLVDEMYRLPRTAQRMFGDKFETAIYGGLTHPAPLVVR